MAKYYCINDDCSQYSKEVDITGTRVLKWDEGLQDYVENINCTKCGFQMYRKPVSSIESVSYINKGASKTSTTHKNTVY